MGARKLRVESEAVLLERLAPPVSEADAEHAAVDSPAMLLQQRLDVAVTAGPLGGQPDPVIIPWSGGVRLAVLVLGAAASWAAAVAAVRALI